MRKWLVVKSELQANICGQTPASVTRSFPVSPITAGFLRDLMPFELVRTDCFFPLFFFAKYEAQHCRIPWLRSANSPDVPPRTFRRDSQLVMFCRLTSTRLKVSIIPKLESLNYNQTGETPSHSSSSEPRALKYWAPARRNLCSLR